MSKTGKTYKTSESRFMRGEQDFKTFHEAEKTGGIADRQAAGPDHKTANAMSKTGG